MDKDPALYFRDELRKARATALADAEAFDAIIVVLERLGDYLKKRSEKKRGLAALKPYLMELADASPLAREAPDTSRGCHLSFGRLFDLVREARNMAIHEGARARHLTEHAIELSLVLEDALMNGLGRCIDRKVEDFMVRNPVTAAPWQPLSFVRQMMLVSSYSYLPVRISKGGAWMLVSDYAVAAYLLRADTKDERDNRLRKTLGQAIEAGPDKLCLKKPEFCEPETPISSLSLEKGLLLLVVNDRSSKTSELLGILSPFDLL